MVVNGYDTVIGKPLKIQEQIENVIKMLSLRNDLVPTSKAGVFTVNALNDVNIPIFPLPISMAGYDSKNITVYDERPFRNKKNDIISKPELNIMRLTAFLQQDVVENNYSVLNASKFVCIKGVAGGFGSIIAKRKGLTGEEKDTLLIILGHYVNCLFEGNTEETGYVSANAIKTAFRIDNSYSQSIIDDIGYLPNIVKVLEAIKTEPSLFKLKNLTLMELIAMSGSLTYVGLGSKVVNVMLESPFLMVGFCYAACKSRMYQKTTLGLQLEYKYNQKLVDAFVQTISLNYDIANID